MFLGNHRSKATVAWKPPTQSASSTTPQGGSPNALSSPMHPSLSAESGTTQNAERPGQAEGVCAVTPGANDSSAGMASPFAASYRPNADSDKHGSNASADGGLHVPEHVQRWVSSPQRSASSALQGMSPQGSNAVAGKAPGQNAGHTATAQSNAAGESSRDEEVGLGEVVKGSGNFEESVPLEFMRGRA
jgi:hypothetical protein